ncbi:MAG TPA: TrkA family potassium uptake protein [Acidimicrobiales bacterium]|nr:TrkA family potassium uptake protein [Acidimicrobiales bacterium]
MHVVIVGCGRVGSGLGISLVADGHSVAIIDKRSSAFRRLPEGWGGQTLSGFGFDRETLEEAGIRRAGALAAVTNGDNSNILSARIARETYEVESVVARIYDPRRATIYRRLGIPTVATVTWTTDQVLRRLFPERAEVEWSSPAGELCLIERALPPGWAGRKIKQLDAPGQIQVVGITRAEEARLATDEIGQEGDILHIAVQRPALEDLERRLKAPDL